MLTVQLRETIYGVGRGGPYQDALMRSAEEGEAMASSPYTKRRFLVLVEKAPNAKRWKFGPVIVSRISPDHFVADDRAPDYPSNDPSREVPPADADVTNGLRR
jgi:hypothetical protein